MYVLAVDIGYSNLKVVRGHVDRPELDICIMPVGAAPIEMACTDLNGKVEEGVEVSLDGKKYIAGVEPRSLSNWQRALHAYSGANRTPIPLQSGPPVPEQTGPGIPL